MMNDRGILATYFSALSKITNPEHTSQYNIVKVLDSERVNDILINIAITVTLHDILVTFRDTDKKFELQEALLKMITNKN